MYFSSFESVFNAVEKGLCKYGILPIENSSYGSVNEVYDLMKKYSFYTIRSSKLKINHALLANEGASLSDIKEVYTHEQALGQCSDFINAHKEIKFLPCENTAVAAKKVAESGRKDVAAISSMNCSKIYGLVPLKHGIQNSDEIIPVLYVSQKTSKYTPAQTRSAL
jgi:chorismate mutase/prephenate dehydratase